MNKLTLARSIVLAASVSLASLTGCAPERVIDGAPNAQRDDLAAPSNATASTNSSTTPTTVLGATDARGITDGDITDDAVSAVHVAPFSEAAFKSAVIAATAGRDAAPLPAIESANGDLAFRSVLSLVARSSGVSVDDVTVEVQACGAEGQERCARRFTRLIAASDFELSKSLAPLARRLVMEVPDARLVVWKPTRDGESLGSAVTLFGVRSGRLLGMIAFR